MDTRTQTSADPTDLARLQLQERLAAANGFSLAPPVYALGTRVNSIGVENFTRSRTDWAALPPARTIFAPFLERVAAEQRKDWEVAVNDIRMLPDGKLVRESTGRRRQLFLTGDAPLMQLLARTKCEAPSAAATYLSTIPAERRANEVNAWLRETPPDKNLVLRTRLSLAPIDSDLAPYGREVFAIVSSRYGRGVEVDELGRALLKAIETRLLPGDARGEVTYDGRHASIRALWHSNVNPKSVCAGEVFKAGVTIGANDDGSEALHVDATAWRNLCLNLIIVQEAKQSFGKRRHIGSAADLSAWLFEALARATSSVRAFAEMWDSARSLSLTDPAVVRDVPKALAAAKSLADREKLVGGVFRGLLKTNRLSLPSYRGERSVEVLMGAWKKEPELTKVGVVNAVTRAAHSAEFKSVWATEEVEERAGDLLRSRRPFDFVEEGGDF